MGLEGVQFAGDGPLHPLYGGFLRSGGYGSAHGAKFGNPAHCPTSFMGMYPPLLLPSLHMYPLVTRSRWPLTTLAVLIALVAQAQEPKPRVLLQKDRLTAQFDTVNVVKNVVKLNPLLLLRGEVPIFYERALTYKLSVEVGLGVTFRDYLRLSFGGDDVDDFGTGIEVVSRPTYHLGVRYYLGQDLEPQGGYLQLQFSHLDYIKDVRVQSIDGEFTNDKLRDRRVYNDLRLLAGYQMLSGNSNWMFDLYGGLGMRSRAMDKVRENYDTVTRLYSYEVVKQNDIAPAFFLGVKVGLGF